MPSKKPKVSVVLPVYRGADYLAESIQSVLDQTLQEWELIIVDDCSPDNSFEIAQEFAQKDKRIKAYQNEKNLMLPGNLNAGFSKATGQYFSWTSHDNRYLPEALEKLATYLDEHGDTGLVYADMLEMNAAGKTWEGPARPAPENILYQNCVGAAFMYRAELAKKVGDYDVNRFLAEDYQYWLRLSRHGKIAYLPETLYAYRRHSKSLSSTRLIKIIKMDKDMRQEFVRTHAVPELDEARFIESYTRPMFNATFRRMPIMVLRVIRRKCAWSEFADYAQQALPEAGKLIITKPVRTLVYFGQDLKLAFKRLIGQGGPSAGAI